MHCCSSFSPSFTATIVLLLLVEVITRGDSFAIASNRGKLTSCTIRSSRTSRMKEEENKNSMKLRMGDNSDLEGQEPVIVLVTGSSTGIGKSTALAFSENPRFKVYATMRDISKWNGPVNQENLIVTALDVSSEQSVNAAVAELESKEGRGVSIVINNAGYGMVGYLESVDVDQAKEVFDVNVFGAVRVLQACLPSMRKSGGGYIINVSSLSGIRGIPCFEFYTGSKFALEGIMDSLRYTLASFNIGITNVNPGPVRTAFGDRLGKVSAGGRGTRVIPLDEGDWIQNMTDDMVNTLSKRVQEDNNAQSSEEVANLLVDLACKYLEDPIKPVPFNTGSCETSQKILEDLKRHPTGWGGTTFENIKNFVPQRK